METTENVEINSRRRIQAPPTLPSSKVSNLDANSSSSSSSSSRKPISAPPTLSEKQNSGNSEIKETREELRQRLKNKIKGKSHTAALPIRASDVKSMLNSNIVGKVLGNEKTANIVDSAKQLIGSMNDEDINKLIAQAMTSTGAGGGRKKLKKNLKKIISNDSAVTDN
jgi:hypothetical protein